MGEGITEKRFGFDRAMLCLKQRQKVTRDGFRDTCYVEAQYPDEGSKNTEPYLVMVKGEKRFPVDLGCESLFAEDWKLMG